MIVSVVQIVVHVAELWLEGRGKMVISEAWLDVADEPVP
jgi:hypothetical protein